jgi:hypothetical protein
MTLEVRGMKLVLVTLTALVLPLVIVAAPAPDDDTAKGKKVEFDVHDGHFEKNNSGLKGESSYLEFSDRDAFDKVFGLGRVMRKQNFVPKDAFDKKMVVAVIKRGNALTTYKVDKVTADGGTLYVQYTAKMGEAGTATFHSPLIVSVDKGKYTKVVFIENGKKADTLKVEK